MRRSYSILIIGIILLVSTGRWAIAQDGPGREGIIRSTPVTSADLPEFPSYPTQRLESGSYSVFGAPGYFGVAYGSPSFGMTRAYTAFASPFGAGYGYGYSPYAYMPGRFGVGLWNPSQAAGWSVSTPGFYRTFPVPYHPDVISPPLGAYAPGYGPPAYQSW